MNFLNTEFYFLQTIMQQKIIKTKRYKKNQIFNLKIQNQTVKHKKNKIYSLNSPMEKGI